MKLFIIFAFLGILAFSLGALLGLSKNKPIPEKKSVKPIVISHELSSEKLTQLVNIWRTESGFQPYIEDERLCHVASDRAQDGPDMHRGLHEKFNSDRWNGIIPFGTIISENIVRAPTEEDALKRWLDSEPHKKALEANWKYSCIRCLGNDCVQIFSNF